MVHSPVAEVRAVGIPVLSHRADIANARVEFEDRRQDYGERRRVLLCPVAGRLIHVTYTLRGERRRIISARAASRLERRIYAQIIEASDPGDSE